jgi:molecular chaperone GrpE
MVDERPDRPAGDEPVGVDTPDPPEPQYGPDPALAAMTRERDDLYDRLLRTTAEFDNYRRRVERERRALADQTVVDLLLELLLVVDDFERALSTSSDAVPDAYRKGIELIYGKLHELLRKQGLQPVDTVGQDFNPEFHQAVTYEASPGARDGEVVGELRRGYLLGDRLLRPAMVKVAKA